MNRKVVTIFGGTGFVGRQLVYRLASRGAEVRVAARNFDAASHLKMAGDIGQVVPIQTDVTDAVQVANAVAGASDVINLVGIIYERGQRTFQRMHVDAALNIAQASSNAKVKRLVHMSALGADANSPAEYARTKAAGERAVLETFKRATIFRPSVIFGADDNFFNLFAGLMRFTPFMPVFGAPALPTVSFGGKGAIDINFFGKGGCKFQPVFVCDITEALARVLEDRASEGITYELGGPRVYSFKEIIEVLLAVTERRRIFVPIPYGIAAAKAIFLQLLPKPLLTLDQVNLLRVDNVVSGHAPGFDDLEICPKAAEAILPTYLHRFRKPKHRDIHGSAS